MHTLYRSRSQSLDVLTLYYYTHKLKTVVIYIFLRHALTAADDLRAHKHINILYYYVDIMTIGTHVLYTLDLHVIKYIRTKEE